MLVLEVLHGEVPGRLLRAVVAQKIGRTEGDLRLDDTRVSKRHAVVWPRAGGWLIRDLGSSNGTWVNDCRLDHPTPLLVGDHLRIGRVVLAVREAAPNGVPVLETDPSPDPPQAITHLTLLARWPGRNGRHVEHRELLVALGPEEIGRHAPRLRLGDSRVSRQHARVWPNGGHWLIEDLGSSRGTLLNGEPLRQPRALAIGDQIRAGRATLTVQDAVVASPGALAAAPDTPPIAMTSPTSSRTDEDSTADLVSLWDAPEVIPLGADPSMATQVPFDDPPEDAEPGVSHSPARHDRVHTDQPARDEISARWSAAPATPDPAPATDEASRPPLPALNGAPPARPVAAPVDPPPVAEPPEPSPRENAAAPEVEAAPPPPADVVASVPLDEAPAAMASPAEAAPEERDKTEIVEPQARNGTAAPAHTADAVSDDAAGGAEREAAAVVRAVIPLPPRSLVASVNGELEGKDDQALAVVAASMDEAADGEPTADADVRLLMHVIAQRADADSDLPATDATELEWVWGDASASYWGLQPLAGAVHREKELINFQDAEVAEAFDALEAIWASAASEGPQDEAPLGPEIVEPDTAQAAGPLEEPAADDPAELPAEATVTADDDADVDNPMTSGLNEEASTDEAFATSAAFAETSDDGGESTVPAAVSEPAESSVVTETAVIEVDDRSGDEEETSVTPEDDQTLDLGEPLDLTTTAAVEPDWVMLGVEPLTEATSEAPAPGEPSEEQRRASDAAAVEDATVADEALQEAGDRSTISETVTDESEAGEAATDDEAAADVLDAVAPQPRTADDAATEPAVEALDAALEPAAEPLDDLVAELADAAPPSPADDPAVLPLDEPSLASAPAAELVAPPEEAEELAAEAASAPDEPARPSVTEDAGLAEASGRPEPAVEAQAVPPNITDAASAAEAEAEAAPVAHHGQEQQQEQTEAGPPEAKSATADAPAGGGPNWVLLETADATEDAPSDPLEPSTVAEERTPAAAAELVGAAQGTAAPAADSAEVVDWDDPDPDATLPQLAPERGLTKTNAHLESLSVIRNSGDPVLRHFEMVFPHVNPSRPRNVRQLQPIVPEFPHPRPRRRPRGLLAMLGIGRRDEDDWR